MQRLARQNYYLLLLFLYVTASKAQTAHQKVAQATMQSIYDEVKTPFKYGLVITPEDNSKKVDCPSVFRKGSDWYMTYVVFDGKGYETWLAKSSNLLHWKTLGRALSFSKDSVWDKNQKAGYIALKNTEWGGSY